MRRILVAGNWKMNGSLAGSETLLGGIIDGLPDGSGFEVLVCPPFPYLATAAQRARGTALKVGAQNVSEHSSGAFTGETSPAMLVDVGCEYAIVGHSERRSLYGESSAQVAGQIRRRSGGRLASDSLRWRNA